ncbi:hypothetical protein [Archangium primigenium]|uniref:hypothetical protein n=1 Tax=[Archangium] primigenium TaxID=2792470 RepID=UPI0019591BCE|nr:hypothetical protein [Archangium primigenium]MBM7118568.1 hypothetical protein [Archangium primigenium]
MTHLHPPRSPRQRGLALIQVAIVLAIAGVVIGGVVVLYLSTSNQRKITDTSQLIVSAVQKISDLFQGKNMKELTGQVAVDFGALPKTYADGNARYDLPIAPAKMTFGATDFSPGRNLGVISVGPLASDQCIALGKLDLGDVVKYVTVSTQAVFTEKSEADLAARSVKNAQGDVPIAALGKACTEDSYVSYYLQN